MHATARLKRGYSDCRFGQLHWYAGGPHTGRAPLLFLHQNPTSLVEYLPLIQRMANRGPVLAFDTPGSGGSDSPPEIPAPGAYAEAFLEGLDALATTIAGPFDVFGYHTSCVYAVELAALRPGLIRRLVLCAIPYYDAEQRAEALHRFRATPPLADDGKRFFERLNWLWQDTVHDRVVGMPLRRASAIFASKVAPLDRFWWPYEGVWSQPLDESLKSIRHPTLVLQPNEKFRDNMLFAASLIPGVKIVELPELDRDIFDVGTAQLERELQSFLD